MIGRGVVDLQSQSMHGLTQWQAPAGTGVLSFLVILSPYAAACASVVELKTLSSRNASRSASL